MSLQENVESTTGIKYVKVDSVAGTEPVNVWAVVESATGKERGFVASTAEPYESNSNQMYNPVKWGSATQREKLSDLSFPYTARSNASLALMKNR